MGWHFSMLCMESLPKYVYIMFIIFFICIFIIVTVLVVDKESVATVV